MAWMRKSEPEVGSASTSSPGATPPAAPTSRREKEMKKETKMENLVNIGQSVQIKGELTGDEDLTIDGKVDGKIMVRDHSLTIGTNGKITAEVHAKTIVVVGHVQGNITADDKVEISSSGSVEGDIRAPRVAIADGARFKGSIDMERASAGSSTQTAAPAKSAAISTPARDMQRSASAAKV